MATQHLQQTALITGASSGIGFELARVFAEEGYNLVIVARDQNDLEDLAVDLSSEFNVQVTPIAADLFQREAAEQLYGDVTMRGIRVDVLVNNAGQGQWGNLTETDLSRQLDIIQLNVVSVVTLTYLFLKDMVARNEGKILNLGSVASVMPHPRMAVYAGTKAFILSFSEGLRRELKETNITITTLLPGPTDTDFFNKADMEHTVAGQMKKADSVSVAEAGYQALMDGDDKLVQGWMNKLQIATTNILPETWVAAMAGMLTKSKNDDNGK